MIRNICKIAFRNIAKHKLYSAINVLGLAIGFTAFILISLFLKYEYSWDKHNVNYDRIYRVQIRAILAGKQEIWNQTPPPLTDILKEKYPEFEKVALMREAWGEFLSSSESQTFHDYDGFYAEPSVFDIFTYRFILGNKADALSEPFSIVLSKTLADKLFPKENAFGKTITLEKKFNLKVTGVYDDLPKNSHKRPSYLISFSSFAKTMNWKDYRSQWNTSFRTYVLLKKGIDYKALNKKIEKLINEIHNDKVTQNTYLQPLSKLYLQPEDKNDYMVAIFIYGMVALFILLLSVINYINLSTSNASIRTKEIAMRKVNGSSKGMLIGQFLGETVILAILAVNVALLFSELLLPVFNKIVHREIIFSYAKNGSFICFIIGIATITGLLSGIYPAFVLSSLKLSDLLKGNVYSRLKREIGPKKILVTFQYVISLFILIQSVLVMEQIKFMMNKNLGFNKENLLFTQFKPTRALNFEDLRNKILKHPEILDFSVSQSIPFCGSSGWPMTWEGNPSDERVDIRYNEVSVDFVKTFGMDITKGRDFSRGFGSDKDKACLINETACKRFGWTDPIGKTVNDSWQVIGVVRDFHPYSVHQAIPPYVMKMTTSSINDNCVCSFRIFPGKLSEARKILTSEFEAYFPTDPFEFKVFSEYYKKDGTFEVWESVNHTFLFFNVLLILLTILGIFGLVSFTTQRKTKEIGIRKVLGSSIAIIYLKLTKEFMVLLLVAIVIAWPATYLMYQKYPGAYKPGVHPWEFLLSTSIILLITLLTTSYHTIKISLTNPLEALRYE